MSGFQAEVAEGRGQVSGQGVLHPLARLLK